MAVIEEIVELEKLNKGDHIAVCSLFRNLHPSLKNLYPLFSDKEYYYHHGVYLGNFKVVHVYGDDVEEAYPRTCDLLPFLNGGFDRKLYRVNHDKPVTVEETLRKAREILHNPEKWGGFSIFWNNCETFAIYLKTGKKLSYQVSEALNRGDSRAIVARVAAFGLDVTGITGPGSVASLRFCGSVNPKSSFGGGKCRSSGETPFDEASWSPDEESRLCSEGGCSCGGAGCSCGRTGCSCGQTGCSCDQTGSCGERDCSCGETYCCCGGTGFSSGQTGCSCGQKGCSCWETGCSCGGTGCSCGGTGCSYGTTGNSCGDMFESFSGEADSYDEIRGPYHTESNSLAANDDPSCGTCGSCGGKDSSSGGKDGQSTTPGEEDFLLVDTGDLCKEVSSSNQNDDSSDVEEDSLGKTCNSCDGQHGTPGWNCGSCGKKDSPPVRAADSWWKRWLI